jgi:CBS domain-containing protein
MPVGDYCRRNVGTIEIGATLAAAAARMSEEQAGCLAVFDVADKLCALVTDRDLALRGLCGRLDANTTTLSSIVIRDDLVFVREETAVRVAVGMMRRHGLRRLLVLDRKKNLVGILHWDDIVGLLAQELGGIATAIGAQAPHPGVPRSRALMEVIEP